MKSVMSIISDHFAFKFGLNSITLISMNFNVIWKLTMPISSIKCIFIGSNDSQFRECSKIIGWGGSARNGGGQKFF